MKKLFLIISIFTLLACEKEAMMATTEQPINMTTFNADEQKLIYSGDFESAVHPTSGKVKIYEDKAKKKTLVFENFKTDAGPDLRIYLAEDKVVTNFIEISTMVNNGNSTYALPEQVDLSKQKYVLIWCKKFAVLFGSAQLK